MNWASKIAVIWVAVATRWKSRLLKGNFKQSTFELSATRCPGGAGGCIIDAKYKSSGAEFFGTYQNGGFIAGGQRNLFQGKAIGRRSHRLSPRILYARPDLHGIGQL